MIPRRKKRSQSQTLSPNLPSRTKKIPWLKTQRTKRRRTERNDSFYPYSEPELLLFQVNYIGANLGFKI